MALACCRRPAPHMSAAQNRSRTHDRPMHLPQLMAHPHPTPPTDTKVPPMDTKAPPGPPTRKTLHPTLPSALPTAGRPTLKPYRHPHMYMPPPA